MCNFALQWIRTRTGISARRVLRHGEHLRDLALRAGRDALASSGVRAKDIDLVLHASSSPDDLFGDGPWLGAELQAPGDAAPPAFDITAACSGFVVGLVTGAVLPVLVIEMLAELKGTEMHVYLPWLDDAYAQQTCI